MKDQAHRMTLAEMIRYRGIEFDDRWNECDRGCRNADQHAAHPISPYVKRALANDLPRNNAVPLVYWPADRNDRP